MPTLFCHIFPALASNIVFIFVSFGVLQSDQYHYLHHRFFECNYGTSGTPWDKMFGTFRDKLKVKVNYFSSATTLFLKRIRD